MPERRKMLASFKEQNKEDSSGRIIVLTIPLLSLLQMILLSYISPHHIGAATWLAAFGAGSESAGNLCTLVCPKVPADDSAWQLRAQPQEHACLSTAILPVPCAPNYTHSELLRMVGGQAGGPNSKHWFTTSFLQPLPYLVTP